MVNRGELRMENHYYSLLTIYQMWPDPGLTRNTRRDCYRCSVPGLAGFTKQALCGARDLITQLIANCRLPIANWKIIPDLDLSSTFQTPMLMN